MPNHRLLHCLCLGEPWHWLSLPTLKLPSCTAARNDRPLPWTWIVVHTSIAGSGGYRLSRNAPAAPFLCLGEPWRCWSVARTSLLCWSAKPLAVRVHRPLVGNNDRRDGLSADSCSDRDVQLGICSGLTFDMRGGRQLAKPDVARPLDGRVRALLAIHDELLSACVIEDRLTRLAMLIGRACLPERPTNERACILHLILATRDLPGCGSIRTRTFCGAVLPALTRKSRW